jgi:hypothetical protein
VNRRFQRREVRYGGAPAPAFLPTSLASLALWLRADAANVTLNGGDVSAWADQSGTGDANKNFLQGTAANQPLYVAADASYNNQPTISFSDVAPDYLQNAGAWAAPVASGWTVYFVGNAGSVASTRDVFDLATGDFLLLRQRTTSNVELMSATLGTSILAAGTITAPSVVALVGNGASSAIYLNSLTAFATGNLGAQSITRGTIGCSAAIGGAMGGKAAEMIVYSTVHDAATRARVMSYLSTRYAITVSP